MPDALFFRAAWENDKIFVKSLTVIQCEKKR